MAIPYIVCRKVDATKKEKPQLWYAVGKKIQKKSGRTERDVAHRVAQRTGFHPGVVEAVLAATGEIIEEELSDGRSDVTRHRVVSDGSHEQGVRTPGRCVATFRQTLTRVLQGGSYADVGRETCGMPSDSV